MAPPWPGRLLRTLKVCSPNGQQSGGASADPSEALVARDVEEGLTKGRMNMARATLPMTRSWRSARERRIDRATTTGERSLVRHSFQGRQWGTAEPRASPAFCLISQDLNAPVGHIGHLGFQALVCCR